MHAHEPLRLHVRRAGIVLSHPLEHLEEVGFGVPDLKIRCTVWQSVQLSITRLISSGPGALMIHSALAIWSGRGGAGLSLRSATVGLPCAMSISGAPSSA